MLCEQSLIAPYLNGWQNIWRQKNPVIWSWYLKEKTGWDWVHMDSDWRGLEAWLNENISQNVPSFHSFKVGGCRIVWLLRWWPPWTISTRHWSQCRYFGAILGAWWDFCAGYHNLSKSSAEINPIDDECRGQLILIERLLQSDYHKWWGYASCPMLLRLSPVLSDPPLKHHS